MRVTVDTAVLVRMNVRAQGPARQLLSYFRESGATLVLSPFILDEVERVLSYPRMRALFKLNGEEIRAHIDELSAVAEIVTPAEGAPLVLSDPDDDPIVYTAIAGDADYLCTTDRHFYKPTVLSICSRYGIQVVHDVELLQILRESLGRPS